MLVLIMLKWNPLFGDSVNHPDGHYWMHDGRILFDNRLFKIEEL